MERPVWPVWVVKVATPPTACMEVVPSSVAPLGPPVAMATVTSDP